MRDKNGFLDINGYIDMQRKVKGYHKSCWLSNGEQEGVFKPVHGISLYREIFYPIILRNIKINIVENDLATYQNRYGIFSKSYHSYHTPKIKTYSFCDIIKKYCEEILKVYFNYGLKYKLHNMSNMIFILKWFCKMNNVQFQEDSIKHELLISFIMQILLANKDNNTINNEVYFEEILNFSPFFDFEYYGDINLENKSTKNYYFGFYTDRSVEKPNTYIETIEYFKHYATKEEMEIFMTYLEQLQMLQIDDQYEEIEANIHAHIPEPTKLKLKKDYESNLKNVDALINDKK